MRSERRGRRGFRRIPEEMELAPPAARGEAQRPSERAGEGAGGTDFPRFAGRYWRAARRWPSARAFFDDCRTAPAAGPAADASEGDAAAAAAPQMNKKVRRAGADGQTLAMERRPHGVLPEALDLSRLRDRADSGPSELELRREKFALFEKHCTLALEDEGVYIGSDAVARNWDTLSEQGITHVLNCVGFVCEEYFKGKLTYKTLWLQDSPGEDIASVLYPCFDFLEAARSANGRVLVHCSQGVSRSSAIVIAYAMWRRGWEYEPAFQYVKQRRGVANPNVGFACQLLAWRKRLGTPPTASAAAATPRLLRIVQHSEHGSPPLLVGRALPTVADGDADAPRTASLSGKQALEDAGCFVLQAGESVYVWCGASADDAHTVAAWSLARQLVDYEGCAAPPVAVSPDAAEPASFLATLDGMRFDSTNKM